MRPSDNLQVVVTTDKSIYCPGDLVSYQVTVLNSSNNQIVNDAYVSITATDDSVFT